MTAISLALYSHLEAVTSTREAASFNVRNATSLALAAALADDTAVCIEGLDYLVDSSAIGTASAGNDQGVNGIVPLGRVTFGHYGCVGDWDGTQSTAGNGTDNTTRIQAAVDFCFAQGGRRLYAQPGRYRTTSPINITITGSDDPINGSMNGFTLEGDGPGASQIVADHNGRCVAVYGGSGAGWHTFFSLDGIGLLKGDYGRTTGSVGLFMDQCAFFEAGRFDFSGFEFGIKGVDVLSGTFTDGTIRLNNDGFDFRKGTRSHPNNIAFRGVKTLNNYVRGGTLIKPGVFNYTGGSIESNGLNGTLADATGYGLYVENAGVEGSIGINLEGVYIEGNNGRADVHILQNSAGVAGAALHKISGCSFLRFVSTRYTTRNILFDCTNDSKIYVGGSGFKDFSPYTSDGARPFIAAGNAQIIDGGGNLMLDNAGGNIGISRAVFAPIGINHQLTFAALPDAAKNRNGIAYCSDGTGSLTPAIAVSDGVDWWQIPLGQFAGNVDSTGSALKLPRGWTSTRASTGVYTITHNLSLGTNTYAVIATPIGLPGQGYCSGKSMSSNSFEIYFADTSGALADMDFSFNMQII